MMLWNPYSRFGIPAAQIAWVRSFGPVPEGFSVYRKCGRGFCTDEGCMFLARSNQGRKIGAMREKGILTLFIRENRLAYLPVGRMDRWKPGDPVQKTDVPRVERAAAKPVQYLPDLISSSSYQELKRQFAPTPDQRAQIAEYEAWSGGSG